jgi:hypothetical protein
MFGRGLAVVLAVSALSLGCGHKQEIEKAATRAEDAARRAEAAAGRVEAAAKRAETAAERAEQMVSHAVGRK